MGEEPQAIYESPGQLLFVRRNELALELADLQDKLKIPRRYLQAIEMEQYEKLPPLVYAKHIIKKYVVFLSLDGYGVEDVYIQRMEQAMHHTSSAPPLQLPSTRFSHRFFDISKIFKFGISTVVLIFSMFYFFWQIRETFLPPFLDIYQPDDQVVIVDEAIMVVGKSEPEAEITINDALVVGDREGNFATVVPLRSGVNMITITARKKHGIEARLQRQIFMQQEIKTPIFEDKEVSGNYSFPLF